ncbi:hypothetical protein [Haloplanus pelagicus]|jgi:hypothetical protein|uniref:hypothetical protein n=1 Tax=Haloplanus pelagicus TaxID=2949995 RepID=UPI00203B3A4F|nr:hypothetical protein [Haloplanus sp. HW8-1]
MSRLSRRRLLETAGVASVLALAGCSSDADTDGTPTRTGTATATPSPRPTPTATPRPAPRETVGFAAMLSRTPTHPEMPDESYLWARYLDAAGLLADVDDDTVGQRLRQGWLGSGPPKYADSDAFELVHVQPGGRSNVTFGRGAYVADAAVEGMVADGWTRLEEGTAGDVRLEYGGYTAAVGERHWIVVSAADADLLGSLVAAVEDDPLVDHLDDVDAAALSRATDENGSYQVIQRSVPGDYAAGIAVDYAPYRYPIGVLHYATGRASPSWERVERRFEAQVAGELRATDFGDDFG